jgi:hypothetical protein
MKIMMSSMFAVLWVSGCITVGAGRDGDPIDDEAQIATAVLSTSEILNGHDPGRCLDAELQSIAGNGTKVQLWDCSGANQQQWQTTFTGVSTIRNARSGRCLDAQLQSINRNGTKVQLWDCNGSDQQLWRFNSSATITNVHSGRCLDAQLQSINNNGTIVQLWDCNGGDQQLWF